MFFKEGMEDQTSAFCSFIISKHLLSSLSQDGSCTYRHLFQAGRREKELKMKGKKAEWPVGKPCSGTCPFHIDILTHMASAGGCGYRACWGGGRFQQGPICTGFSVQNGVKCWAEHICLLFLILMIIPFIFLNLYDIHWFKGGFHHVEELSV